MGMGSSYVKRGTSINTELPAIKKESLGSQLGRIIGYGMNAYQQIPATKRWEWFGDKNALRQAVKAGYMNPDGTYVVDTQMEEWKKNKENANKKNVIVAGKDTDIESRENYMGIPTEEEDLKNYKPYYIPETGAESAYNAFEEAKPEGYGDEMSEAELDPTQLTEDEIREWQDYLGVEADGKWGDITQEAYDRKKRSEDETSNMEGYNPNGMPPIQEEEMEYGRDLSNNLGMKSSVDERYRRDALSEAEMDNPRMDGYFSSSMPPIPNEARGYGYGRRR